MRWDRFFEDLEDQLDSEWEAERAALDSEAERLRLSRIALRERLVALSDGEPCELSAELVGGTVLTGCVAAVGADWFALAAEGARQGATLVPLGAVTALGLGHVDVISSARAASPGSALRQRMSFGFVLRDLARKRVPVSVLAANARTYVGTIDRAGADHLDLALHDAGAPRRAASITGHRLIAFSSVVAVRPDAPAELP